MPTHKFPPRSSAMAVIHWAVGRFLSRNTLKSYPLYLFKPFSVPNHIMPALSWKMLLILLCESPCSIFNLSILTFSFCSPTRAIAIEKLNNIKKVKNPLEVKLHILRAIGFRGRCKHCRRGSCIRWFCRFIYLIVAEIETYFKQISLKRKRNCRFSFS